MMKVNDNWVYIDTDAELSSVLDRLLVANVLGIDTETTGLNPHQDRLRLIQIAQEGHPTVIVDCFYMPRESLLRLEPVFDSESVKVFQNAKFDLQFLRSAGFEVSGPIFDTMLAAQLLRSSGGSPRAGLGALAAFYLDIQLPKEQQTSDFSIKLSRAQLEYAARDAAILLMLRRTMIEYIRDNHLIEVARLEFQCVYAIAEMEYRGIYLDLDRWTILTKATEKHREQAMESLYPYTGYPTIQTSLLGEERVQGVNMDSTKQVMNLLQQQGIHVDNTSKHSLMPYQDHPVVQALLSYRHAAKALSSFLHPIPQLIQAATGRLHPRYAQIGAWSGRMSCGNPNIQQIPRDHAFRSCFAAPAGRKLIVADYSQIELRVIAQISKDERMILAYRKGEDLHALTASLVSGKSIDAIDKSERQAAKAVNFGLVFGMGAAGLKDYAHDTYGVDMSLEQATVFRERFFKGYPGIEAWHNKLKRRQQNESRTLAGRKHIFNENSGASGRYNTPVQGTAADILKNALGMLVKRLRGTSTYIVAVVHDEIVLECDASQAAFAARLLSETMEEAGRQYLTDVPVVAECSIGDSWAQK